MNNLAHSIHNSQPELSISPVVSKSDIKHLAYIHVEALRDDASATVKFASQDEFRVKIEHMLEGQVSDGDEREDLEPLIKSRFGRSSVNDWFIVKASLKTSDSNGQPEKIIGWASWLHENPSLGEETNIPLSATKQHGEPNDRKLLQFNQGLGAFVRQYQSGVYRDWCRKRRRENKGSGVYGLLSLRSCFILPEYQRQGAGAALVRYGCERADAFMLDTLVTSTQVAKALYESAGNFEAFDHLEVDLNKFDDKKRVQDPESLEPPRYYGFWFMARLSPGTSEAPPRAVDIEAS